MLIWLCALHCEAKPVIDHYRLHKLNDPHGFDLYQGEETACIVSGIGDLNMAAACAWAAARFEREAGCWINLGVAGHRTLDLGTPVIANKVTHPNHAHAIYPVPLVKHGFASRSVISLPGESVDYAEDALYDMEADAFLHSCSRFTPLELCQAVKIVSDNADNPPTRDKAVISALIAASMPEIAAYAGTLQDLAAAYAEQSLTDAEFTRFVALGHFTRSQQIQLRKALLGLRAFDPALDASYRLASGLADSRQIIQNLQQQLQQHSEQL